MVFDIVCCLRKDVFRVHIVHRVRPVHLCVNQHANSNSSKIGELPSSAHIMCVRTYIVKNGRSQLTLPTATAAGADLDDAL